MENLEQLVEIPSKSHTEISNLRKKSSRSISLKILPSVCSVITLIEENVKLETDLSSATFRAIYNYKDGRKNRIFLSVLRRFWSRNVHIIGAHVRPFHAITSAKQSIQLWVGQRGVWYASWSRYAKEKNIYNHVIIWQYGSFPWIAFYWKCQRRRLFIFPALNNTVLQKNSYWIGVRVVFKCNKAPLPGNNWHVHIWCRLSLMISDKELSSKQKSLLACRI